MRQWIVPTAVFFFVVLLAALSQNHVRPVYAQTCSLHNAIQQNNHSSLVDITGVRGGLIYTNPPLNKTTRPAGVYSRLILYYTNPYDPAAVNFVEAGWVKEIDEGTGQVVTRVLIGYYYPGIPTGMVINERYNISVNENNTVKIRLSSQTGKHRVDWNGTKVRQVPGLVQYYFNIVAGGGETLCGVESMNCFLAYNLEWRNLTNVWAPWGYHWDGGDNAPYRNVNWETDPNNGFYSTDNSAGCSLADPPATITWDDDTEEE